MSIQRGWNQVFRLTPRDLTNQSNNVVKSRSSVRFCDFYDRFIVDVEQLPNRIVAIAENKHESSSPS